MRKIGHLTSSSGLCTHAYRCGYIPHTIHTPTYTHTIHTPLLVTYIQHTNTHIHARTHTRVCVCWGIDGVQGRVVAEVTILKFTTEMAMEGGKEYGCGGPGEGGDVVWWRG